MAFNADETKKKKLNRNALALPIPLPAPSFHLTPLYPTSSASRKYSNTTPHLTSPPPSPDPRRRGALKTQILQRGRDEQGSAACAGATALASTDVASCRSAAWWRLSRVVALVGGATRGAQCSWTCMCGGGPAYYKHRMDRCVIYLLACMLWR